MSHLQSLTRSLPLARSRASARVAVLTLTNHHNHQLQYSTATQTSARPKILDPAAAGFDANPRDVEKHNREFERRGEGGHPGKVSEGKSAASVKKPGPKIHNTAGVFDGEKRDVERHNREFRERHDRGE
ncbi:hypothetical protein AOL_s00043g630 [Orbilia oligospora ATCC 24927]|uniref:Uncharacterized protein n=2 Tax=Orbilia oligospora TaxID=2813651 RepID=G1X4K6_ARTOA|nr:hypothetical protein AOL_s00043g630 [Orbilia oligospora ATCC 24927]EGX51896.1 hypothetical protein AOL_s00043g630 [Orbilia oligospora ATCC 24927]KAF3279379.1 hypothetical protein TWF970_003944 [Orbilia oligospora]